MIILSGVLVIIAIALLVAGIVVGETGGEIANLVDGMTVIYMSIAVSIVSFLCLLVGVFLRRKELFGAAGGPAAARGKAKDRRSARLKAERAEPDDATELPPSPDVPPEATVYVVLGRKRYHIDTCRQLTGRDKQDLTYVEAREEGFSPCTACMPDTALAARAAARDTTDDDASAASAGSAGGSGSDFGATEVDGGTTISEYGAYGAVDSGYGATAEDGATGDVRVRYEDEARGYAGTEPAGEVGSAYTGSDMSTGFAGARSAGAHTDGAAGASDTYVQILAGTSRYHRPDCALIEDVTGDSGTDDLQSLTATAAQAQGYTACLMCRPDREHAHD